MPGFRQISFNGSLIKCCLLTNKYAKEFREAVKQGKEEKRKGIRGIGKSSNSVGKIVTRFLGDNPKVIDKDEMLKAIMDDPKSFQKFAKSVRNLLRRMMKRRGYEPAELAKILESVDSELKAVYRENRKAASRAQTESQEEAYSTAPKEDFE